MPGSGGIGGGGSIDVWFQVEGQGKKEDKDNSIGEQEECEVTFTFPDGTSKTVSLKGNDKNDKVTYKWKKK
jgi:hypothetical protein